MYELQSDANWWDNQGTGVSQLGYNPWAGYATQTQGQYNDGSYTPLIMNNGDKHAASNATAAVLQANYNEWKNNYFPKIGELTQQTTYENPALMGQELGRAQGQVNNAFGVAQQGQEYQQAKFGMTQTAEQRTANAGQMDIAKSASSVDAANQTRMALGDRNRGIAAGGLPSAIATPK